MQVDLWAAEVSAASPPRLRCQQGRRAGSDLDGKIKELVNNSSRDILTSSPKPGVQILQLNNFTKGALIPEQLIFF